MGVDVKGFGVPYCLGYSHGIGLDFATVCGCGFIFPVLVFSFFLSFIFFFVTIYSSCCCFFPFSLFLYYRFFCFSSISFHFILLIIISSDLASLVSLFSFYSPHSLFPCNLAFPSPFLSCPHFLLHFCSLPYVFALPSSFLIPLLSCCLSLSQSLLTSSPIFSPPCSFLFTHHLSFLFCFTSFPPYTSLTIPFFSHLRSSLYPSPSLLFPVPHTFNYSSSSFITSSPTPLFIQCPFVSLVLCQLRFSAFR